MVEMLVVVLILGLLAGVAVIKLGAVYRDQIAAKARVDVDLLNKAIKDWRADNPSLDFAAEVDVSASASGSTRAVAAWTMVSAFMSLPNGVSSLATYNGSTKTYWAYAHRGTYDASLGAVEPLDACSSGGSGTTTAQPLANHPSGSAWSATPAGVCLLMSVGATDANYMFYAVATK